MKGTVKFYNRDKRFGFITAEYGKDYFFHETGIEPGTSVRDNDAVTFEVVEGDKGPKAEKVKLATGESTEAPVEEAPVEETTEEPAEEATEEVEEENIE